MFGIGVAIVPSEGPLPLVLFLGAVIVPVLFRSWVVADPPARYGQLKGLSYAVVAVTAVGGFARDSLPPVVILAAFLPVVGLYLSAFTVFRSDHGVERVD